MFIQLFFATLHYAILVLTALALFIAGWLYLDSWSTHKKDKPYLFRCIGFLLIALNYIIHATNLEILPLLSLAQILKVAGSILILSTLFVEPILHPPREKVSLVIPFALIIDFFIPSSAVLLFLVAFAYYWKSTQGHEKQIKPVGFAFLFLSLAEFTNILPYLLDTNVVYYSNLLKENGPINMLYYALLLTGTVILVLWAMGYIRFRINVQAFIVTFTSIISIFLVTTFFFTYVLLSNLQNDVLSHLETDTRIMQYALERLQFEAQAKAKIIANNDDIKSSLLRLNGDRLRTITVEQLTAQETSFLLIVDTNSKIIMRAEDPENVGSLLTEDLLLNNALGGSSLTDINVKEGVLSPDVLIRAAAPITSPASDQSDEIIGAVLTGFKIDDAFVDGVKKATGLDVTVFGGNIRAATTFIAPDGKSRQVGTEEQDPKIISKVLDEGEIYIGPTEILNQPFFAAYSPLKGRGDEVVGMLFVGEHQTGLLEAADASIRLTYFGSAILMILSIAPAFFVSRYIQGNLKA